MVRVGDIYAYIDAFAPFATQMDFDNAGLLVGDRDAEVRRILLALDATVEVVNEARRKGCQLLLTHHPLIFHPLRAVCPGDPTQETVAALVRKNIALICAHTNLDLAQGGVNDALMDRLGAQVTGGLEGVGELWMGRMGKLPEAMEPKAFAQRVKKALRTSSVRAVLGNRPVETIAVCGGAGGDLVSLAASLGADAYISAEAKHHEFLAAKALGLTFLDGGHFATEHPVLLPLRQRLQDAFAQKGVEVLISTQKEPYRSV